MINGPLQIKPQPLQTGQEGRPPRFNPSSFFIPGWKGESLSSKSALSLKKVQQALWCDAVTQFKRRPNFNYSLKKSIHNEFLKFAKYYQLHIPELATSDTFWRAFEQENSCHKKVLELFVEKFCFKTVNLYLYKVRFIIAMESENLATVTPRNLLNPHSFFSQVFRPGCAHELVCESLQMNIYSWYHPTAGCAHMMSLAAKAFANVSITEMMILTKFDGETPLRHSPLEGHTTRHRLHSHSLSHKSFGLLLNNLMIFLPIWKQRGKLVYPLPLNDDSLPKILNTKFVGDFLNSLSHSHWLAQEHNQNMVWSEVLCPNFSDKGFQNGKFLRYCHELQFLIFLASYSKSYRVDPLNFIAKAMREKYSKSAEELSGQPSLFSRYDLKKKLFYDFIVLNLYHFPKKNPHHHLLTQISKQKSSLAPNGQLIVFSNQKLFIPSQSGRVVQFLQDFHLELQLDLENLKGRGEIPHYVYIVSKKSPTRGTDDITSFPSFRWSGELSPFEKFHLLVEELVTFFREKSSVSTPLYRKKLAGNLCFEFHQDAVLEGGLLLSSTSKEPNRITHPNFFKNLTKSCSPLEHFFVVEQLDAPNSNRFKYSLATELFGPGFKHEQQFPLVLLVNYSVPSAITLEMVPSNSYRAKLEQYGRAFYQYFGIVPKYKGLNINLFREFFSSHLGRQIIQLSLQGGMAKLKAKLKSLLIPNFLTSPEELPPELCDKSHFLHSHFEVLKEVHPEKIAQQWRCAREQLLKRKPQLSLRTSMGLFANLKFQVEKALEHSDNSNLPINFNNQLVKEALLQLPKQALFPNNDDVYVEPLSEDIHQPLHNMLLKSDSGQHCLSLNAKDGQTIARLYSQSNFLEFIKFILSSAQGSPVSTLLKHLRVPRLDQFQEILRNHEMMDKCLSEILGELQTLILQILTHQLSNPKKCYNNVHGQENLSLL